jgi:hypothetical protein
MHTLSDYLDSILSYVDGKNQGVGVPAELGVLTNRRVIGLLKRHNLTGAQR